MIAARPNPALKRERRGVLAVLEVSAGLAKGRPLLLAIPAGGAMQRCQSDKIQLPTADMVGPIGATSTQAPGGAGDGAGGSQP